MLFLIVRRSPVRICFLLPCSFPHLCRLGGRFQVGTFRGANETGFKEKPYQRASNSEDEDSCSHEDPGNKRFDYVLRHVFDAVIKYREHTFIRKNGPALIWLSVFIATRKRNRDAYSGVFPEVEVDMRFEDIASKGVNDGVTPSIRLRNVFSMSPRLDGAEGRREDIGSQETASDRNQQ